MTFGAGQLQLGPQFLVSRRLAVANVIIRVGAAPLILGPILKALKVRPRPHHPTLAGRPSRPAR